MNLLDIDSVLGSACVLILKLYQSWRPEDYKCAWTKNVVNNEIGEFEKKLNVCVKFGSI